MVAPILPVARVADQDRHANKLGLYFKPHKMSLYDT